MSDNKAIHKFKGGDSFNNRYTLERLVGVGGFADVWKAKDDITGAIVALKIYTNLDDDGIQDLSREYTSMQALVHTNILRADHFDRWGNIPYLVMKFCSGGSLDKKVGKLEPGEAMGILRDVAEGLHYLHQSGIVHQDIKPANVLIDAQGEITHYILSDFGISSKSKTKLSHSVNIKNQGVSMTEAYAPPEKFSPLREDRKPDRKGDIFSLGISMYELVCGYLPFDDLSTGRQLQYENIQVDFSGIEHEKLKRIIALCMQKNRDDRPSAGEIIQMLDSQELPPVASIILGGETAAASTPQSASEAAPTETSDNTDEVSDQPLEGESTLLPTETEANAPLPQDDSKCTRAFTNEEIEQRESPSPIVGEEVDGATVSMDMVGDVTDGNTVDMNSKSVNRDEEIVLPEEKPKKNHHCCLWFVIIFVLLGICGAVLGVLSVFGLGVLDGIMEELDGENQKNEEWVIVADTFTVGGVDFEMMRVTGGDFQMGCNFKDNLASDDEYPVHNVHVSTFYMGRTEVTQALWKAVMGEDNNPSTPKDDNYPVNNVSWNDCQTFIQKLNNATGYSFRLPSEAEWEYAAKINPETQDDGTIEMKSRRFSGGVDDPSSVAWFDENAGELHPVAKLLPNAYGIYDMCGNVIEWCNDYYVNYDTGTAPYGRDNERVLRGGFYSSTKEDIRTTSRGSAPLYISEPFFGLRLALTLTE